MVATFSGNLSGTVISFYSPTNVSKEIGLILFYEQSVSKVIQCGHISVYIYWLSSVIFQV